MELYSEVVINTIKLEIVWTNYEHLHNTVHEIKSTERKKYFSSYKTVESHSQKNWTCLAASVTKSIKTGLLTEGL